MAVFCTKCGAQNEDFAQNCSQCGVALPQIGGYQPIQPPPAYGAVQDWKALGADKKLVAGICGIVVGAFGVHKFILGYTNEGIIQLILGLCFGIGGIIGIIEGIIYLTKSDEEFVRTYIQNKRGWF
ncbi:MAG TPA: TM2 domain-containing protein [Pyrinomonadaceae bacterium]|nr:TM2 domain-containing protein [Pyrinomonadaceae bacterium]